DLDAAGYEILGRQCNRCAGKRWNAASAADVARQIDRPRLARRLEAARPASSPRVEVRRLGLQRNRSKITACFELLLLLDPHHRFDVGLYVGRRALLDRLDQLLRRRRESANGAAFEELALLGSQQLELRSERL